MTIEARGVAHWRSLERRNFRNEAVYPPTPRRSRQLGRSSMTNLAVIIGFRFIVCRVNGKCKGSAQQLERLYWFQ